ncbi:MAG: hypothetical protein ACYCY3_11285 [Halothiobacillus sp.]
METIKALFGILAILGIAYLGLIVVIKILAFILRPVSATLKPVTDYIKKYRLLKYFSPILFSSLALVFFVFIVKPVAFPQFYCESKNKYLSDDDYIKASVSLLNLSLDQGRPLWRINSDELLTPVDRQKIIQAIQRKDIFSIHRPVFRWDGFLWGYFDSDSWVTVRIPIPINTMNNRDVLLGFTFDKCGEFVP